MALKGSSKGREGGEPGEEVEEILEADESLMEESVDREAGVEEEEEEEAGRMTWIKPS